MSREKRERLTKKRRGRTKTEEKVKDEEQEENKGEEKVSTELITLILMICKVTRK